MKHTLKAVQCAKEGKLYLTGTITTPTAGYVVDTTSLRFGQFGDKASLEMDLFAQRGLCIMPAADGEPLVPVTLSFKTDEFIRQLTIYTCDTRLVLKVDRLRSPEPTD